jgi:hypothetical protein
MATKFMFFAAVDDSLLSNYGRYRCQLIIDLTACRQVSSAKRSYTPVVTIIDHAALREVYSAKRS